MKLLTEKDLKLLTAIEVATSIESADHDIEKMKATGPTGVINALQGGPKNGVLLVLRLRGLKDGTGKFKECPRCRKTNHTEGRSFAKKKICINRYNITEI